MKKALYTVNLGGYDKEPIAPRFKGWDSIIISDTKIHRKGWQKVIQVEPTDRPDIESRRYKWLSHILLPQYDLVCYYDANMILRQEPPSYPFRVKHWKRLNVKEEVDACNKQVHRCSVDSLNEELDFFIKDGFPDESGLYVNGFFCRTHEPEENKLCELVFDIIQRFTPRDQVALPYAMWKTNYVLPQIHDRRFHIVMITMMRHRILTPKLHMTKSEVSKITIKPVIVEREVNVHHITPGRADKNLGKAINDIVELLPDDDWVCLRDIDTIPMYHEVFFKQCEDIARSNKHDLVGCMTNRLGFNYQLHNGEKSNDPDIMNHRNIAVELYEKHGSSVKSTNYTIGGLFMLFSKKTWLKAGKFPEGNIFQKNGYIDFHFCRAVKRQRLRIGIAQGIYLFHYYRFHHGSETRSYASQEHLLKII